MQKVRDNLTHNHEEHSQISLLELSQQHQHVVQADQDQSPHLILRIIFLVWKCIKEVFIRIYAYSLCVVNSIRRRINYCRANEYRKNILKYLIWVIILGLSVRALWISNNSNSTSSSSTRLIQEEEEQNHKAGSRNLTLGEKLFLREHQQYQGG